MRRVLRQDPDVILIGEMRVVAGSISVETAMEVASSPHDFKLMLDAQGQRASGIEQVAGGLPEPEDSLQFVKH